jgi:hypothetical protein
MDINGHEVRQWQLWKCRDGKVALIVGLDSTMYPVSYIRNWFPDDGCDSVTVLGSTETGMNATSKEFPSDLIAPITTGQYSLKEHTYYDRPTQDE